MSNPPHSAETAGSGGRLESQQQSEDEPARESVRHPEEAFARTYYLLYELDRAWRHAAQNADQNADQAAPKLQAADLLVDAANEFSDYGWHGPTQGVLVEDLTSTAARAAALEELERLLAAQLIDSVDLPTTLRLTRTRDFVRAAGEAFAALASSPSARTVASDPTGPPASPPSRS